MTLYSNPFIENLRKIDTNRIVLRDRHRHISAQELFNQSKALASWLQKNGVNPGDRTLLLVSPGIDFLKIMYANMMLQTVVSIIDPEMGRENFKSKLSQFAPQHAFVDSRLVLLNEHPVLKYLVLKFNQTIPSFPRLKNCQLFTCGKRLPLLQQHKHIARNKSKLVDEDTELEPSDLNAAFLVTYTSGTLSEPKGVIHTYASLRSSLQHLSNLLAKNGDTAIATHLPHFALLGINAGIMVHLWQNDWPAEKKLEFLSKNNISTLFGPPSDFLPIIDFLKNKGENLPECIKNIYLGSAPVLPHFLKKLIGIAPNARVTCLYGMTENLMVCHVDGRKKLNFSADGDLVGTPFDKVLLTIMPDNEIIIGSDQLYLGYWNLPQRNGAHQTGDLGKIDTEGNLILIGRKKEMIIRRNFNLYPGLYEPTINKIEGIKEAVLLGVYNETIADEEVLLAVETSASISAAQIMKELKTGKYSIDKEAWPDRIIFIEIPHSGRQNKIDRKKLLQLICKH